MFPGIEFEPKYLALHEKIKAIKPGQMSFGDFILWLMKEMDWDFVAAGMVARMYPELFAKPKEEPLPFEILTLP